MLSKQKKRGKAPKQVRRAAVSKAAPKRRAKRQVNNSATAPKTKFVAAPVAMGTVRSAGSRVRFGRAVPHDRYEEGGLRISAYQPSYQDVYAADLTAFGAISSSHYDFFSVSPTAVYMNDTGASTVMFSVQDTFTNVCGSFEEYRIRKLVMHYTPVIGTNTNGATNLTNELQVSYFHTIQDDNIVTNPPRATNGTTVAFPIWEPCSVTLIDEKKSSSSDQLYRTGTIGDGVATHVIANQLCQGQIAFGCARAGTDSADVMIGRIWWEIVVDLYGFLTYWFAENEDRKRSWKEPSKAEVYARRRELAEAKKRVNSGAFDRGDEKHFDFVELPRVKTPPPTARVSSRKS
jgi:hypothetical protein